ncbi:hypothetical protein [Streptomyces sulphureus]|uniref:hypothetical protein n=1 Tax=Streptomyces sulphureus TaxID=47758 RepID=UPI0003678008|nr:hypothetical protein [Streptomyces sulphureus]
MSTAARHPAEERLTARIRTAVEQYAQERGAAPGEGRLDYTRSLADGYAAHREEPGPLAAYLDGLAGELALADVRALRLAGEAAAAVTPRLVEAAADEGVPPPRIAEELGLTPSRVYTLLREQRRERARAVLEGRLSPAEAAGDDPRAALVRYGAALVGLPAEHRETAERFLSGLRAAAEEA